MATIPANHFIFNALQIQPRPINTHLEKAVNVHRRRNWRQPTLFFSSNYGYLRLFKPRNCPCCCVGGDADATKQSSALSDTEPAGSSFFDSGDTYLLLLTRMLGLDNDPQDREQAVIDLWIYALGGKHYVDKIMQSRGCVNLTVNLLRSASSRACEAAAGLLRMISSVNSYKDIVAGSGAIEETTALLRRPSLASDVKEQCICMLWNLSVDERHRMKIANSPLLPLLIKFLDDEDIKIVEAAGGVLANLALSPSTHGIMVELGVIPKMSKFLTKEVEEFKVIGKEAKTELAEDDYNKIQVEGSNVILTSFAKEVERSKVIGKEAKTVLLELAKDDYNKILIVEEGLVLVPLVGSSAYSSFKPDLYSRPSLPDGTELHWSPKPSRFGASEVLLGLNYEEISDKIDESTADAIVGRTRQQFLARIGVIEAEDGEKKPLETGSSTTTTTTTTTGSRHHTLLPWKDGVLRLVLILELEDEAAITRAAEAIAGASVTEHIRNAFKTAGAVNRLVFLSNHSNFAVRSAVVNALEKLSVSNALCETMEAEGIIPSLVNMVKGIETAEALTDKALTILARILDPNKEMRSKFYDGPANGSMKAMYSRGDGTSVSSGNTGEMTDVLDSALVARLVDILKSGSPMLQEKVASILEFLTAIGTGLETIIATDVAPILRCIFEQELTEVYTGTDEDAQEPDYSRLEDAGLAISATSRLLTRLLDHPQFQATIDPARFMPLLRQVLKSDIPIYYKDWVAACLVKLNSISGHSEESPINTEITLYETIPRLIEKIKTSFQAQDQAQESAVVELNRTVSLSEDVVGATRAVAAEGGIPPLVKLLEDGSDRAAEAALAVLYDLSMESENHAVMLEAGATQILRRFVLAERPHWMKALRLLRNLPV